MKLHYGWLIVGLAFLNVLTLYGVWYSYSVLMVSIASDFGWSRTAVSSFFSLFTIIIGLSGPLIGYGIDRAGARAILSIGAVLLGCGLMLCSLAESKASFYIFFGVLAGLGGSSIGLSGNTKTVTSWFTEQRGLAAGIVTSGISAGLLIFVPVMQYWVARYGWRSGFQNLAIMVFAIILPLNALLQKEGPGESAGEVSGSEPKAINIDKGEDRTGLLNRTNFRVIIFVFFSGGLVVQGTLIHQVAIAMDAGFTKDQTSLIFATLGFWGIIGRPMWGILADRLGIATSYTIAGIAMLLGIGAILIACIMQNLPILYAYALFFGLGYSAVAPTNWAIACDYFYGSNFGLIYGLLFCGTALGAALGPILSGFIYDRFSSYVFAYVIIVIPLIFSITLLRNMYAKAQVNRR